MSLPNKQELFDRGLILITRMCELNKLPVPMVRVWDDDHERWPFLSACAYYRTNRIVISLKNCAAIGVAGPAWSYPGYVVDRTPYGVLAHEIGHHFDHHVSDLRGKYFGDFSKNLAEKTGEPKLTNYCPNSAEWFAEMFRLFVTNPLLLEQLRPKTYCELRGRWKPVEVRPWMTVLDAAPIRTQTAALKKVSEVRKMNEVRI